MNRPQTLSMKSFLIRKLAVELQITEKTLEVIINHQFSSAIDDLYRNMSVELSGFGKFTLAESRWNREMKRLEEYLATLNAVLVDEGITERKRKATYSTIATVEDNIKALKAKKHEF